MIYQGKQKIWSEYQKEIPDDHWYYVRSCIRQNFFPASERMFTEITRNVLGKDIHETPSHTTCGGIAYHCDTIPQETVMTIVARQFALMTEAGYENYVASCITVVPTMLAVQYLLLAITIIVVILVTILMEISFISDEKSQIALLKAIGFRNRKIYTWHVLRFAIVTLFAMILAAALSIPMTKLCISPIFGMMGTSKIDYAIDPLQIFLIYPAIIVITTLITAFLTSLTSRSIKSSDTANIE